MLACLAMMRAAVNMLIWLSLGCLGWMLPGCTSLEYQGCELELVLHDLDRARGEMVVITLRENDRTADLAFPLEQIPADGPLVTGKVKKTINQITVAVFASSQCLQRAQVATTPDSICLPLDVWLTESLCHSPEENTGNDSGGDGTDGGVTDDGINDETGADSPDNDALDADVDSPDGSGNEDASMGDADAGSDPGTDSATDGGADGGPDEEPIPCNQGTYACDTGCCPWQIQVAADHDGFYANALILDEADSPIIAYSASSKIQVATYNGSSWDHQLIASGHPASYLGLARDSDKQLVLVFRDSQTFSLIKFHDGIADLSEIEANPTTKVMPSLVLDSANLPRVAYGELSNNSIRYAFWTGAQWELQTVDAGGSPTLRLDTTGLPALFYISQTSARLARFDGSQWNFQTLETLNDPSAGTGLAQDAQGAFHLCYFHMVLGLRYANNLAGSFAIVTVEPVGSGANTGSFCSLALDAQGKAQLAYFDLEQKKVKYARFRNNAWEVSTIDDADSISASPHLTLDAQGRPHLAYFNYLTNELKYATIIARRHEAGR